jgi:molybdopterin-binding protein
VARDASRTIELRTLEVTMELSARNQLAGTVRQVTLAGVMAEVEIELDGGQTVVSAITRASVERMGLREGESVVAIIKATEVLIGKRTG